MGSYQSSPEITGIEQKNKQFPCLSIIISFEPGKSIKAQLHNKIKAAFRKAKDELEKNYHGDKVIEIEKRLEDIETVVDYTTHKKSIAIFVSPKYQKVFYLDIPVNEKIIIDDSFEIRDLVYDKKESQQYLLLILSGKSTRIYLGNSVKLTKIVSNFPDHIAAYLNDMPEKIGKFSDPSHRKEVMLNKFLMHTDAGLSLLLKTYHLPLFVMGDERILGHFRKISHNLQLVVEYIAHDIIHASVPEIRSAIEPHIADWNKIKQKHLLRKLEQSTDARKLVSGLTEVWQEAMQNKGRLLVVEKNYIVPAVKKNERIAVAKELNGNDASIIKDAVDDVIEKVLESGGDVEFVEDGMLEKYNKIALILHY